MKKDVERETWFTKQARDLKGRVTHLLQDFASGDEAVSASEAHCVGGSEGTAVKDLHGLESMLRYDQFDTASGLYHHADCLAGCFEVLPQTGAEETMTERLNAMISALPPGIGMQFCLFGGTVSDDVWQAYKDLRHVAVDNGQTSPFFLELAQRRVAFLREVRANSLWPEEPFTIKQFRLVISITKKGDIRDGRQREDMLELCESVQNALRSAALPAHMMDAAQFIGFMTPIFNPEYLFDDAPYASSDHAAYDEGKPLKDQMLALGKCVQVGINQVVFGTPPSEGGEIDGDAGIDRRVAVRGFSVLRYPKEKRLWEMASIIGDFYDTGLQYPCPFLVCAGVFTQDVNAQESATQFKAARAQQNADSKMARLQPMLAMQAADWKVVMHQMGQGGRLCELYHTVLLFSPLKGMKRASQLAHNIWRQARFTICPMQMLHLPALYASLPMTLTAALRDDLKKLRILTTKTTVNAADMVPVLGEWQGAGDPVISLFGRRGTPTFFDLQSNRQGNSNLFVSGVSGSGKSVTMNEIVISYRSIGAKVMLIDIGRSYEKSIRLQNGTYIEFRRDKPICINPFSWVGADADNNFRDELRMLKPAIGRMASPDAPLSGFKYALLEEAITGVWQDYGTDSNPTLISAYLAGKIKDERGNTEREAFELSKQLRPFTREGIFGAFFNGKATLTLDDDMIGLELEELKNAPPLRLVTSFVLQSRMSHEMYLNRDRKKLYLIDETVQVVDDTPETADFIGEGCRRARKYNGIFCFSTTGIEEVFSNGALKAAYNNCDWKILLRQDKQTIEKLINDGTVSFTPAVKRMLLSLRTETNQYSEMLISSPNGDAVVRHIPDPFSLLMASSRAEDFNECETLRAQGLSTMEALERMVERRRRMTRDARN